MGAQEQAQRQPRRVLRRLPLAAVGDRDRAHHGRPARDRSVTFLLDTNVVSEWVKPEPDPNVVAWLADVDEDRVFLSVVTFAEISRGVELMPAGRRRERLAAWLAAELPARFE